MATHAGDPDREEGAALRPATRLARAGRPAAAGAGVNPPVVRATTLVFETCADMRAAKAARGRGERVIDYGRNGTPTTYALEDAMTALEGGHGCRLFGSGLAAVAACLAAYCKPGQKVLIMRGSYAPAQRVALDYLLPRGVDVEFYRCDLADLDAHLDHRVAFVWAEMPNGPTFEVCDLRQLCCRVREACDAIVAVDNTWAAGLLCHPIELGADVSVISASKGLCGHADLSLGVAVANHRAWPALRDYAEIFGHCITADAAYDALKGLRTLSVRLKAHSERARFVADALSEHPKVRRIHYPAWPHSPDFERWQRDFSGACGLISIELCHTSKAQAEHVIDALALFSIGYSWGGFDSLALLVPAPAQPEYGDDGPHLLRLHIGLEDPEDLAADLLSALDL